ncbi:PHD finger protein 10-like [Oscarella lobularis]|uniref:PHD finger protein 10-like n=1 Tax=Oscarella lobularis TaxID=121494 RepID=UPI003313D2E9
MAKSAKSLEKQTNGADGLPLIDLTFPAERLFEYQWPRDDPSAEFYLLQEQVAEYLGINGTRLSRRARLLFDEGAIDEQQFSQGLTALRSDDVCQLMMREHPDEYRRYARVLQDRELKKRADEQKALVSSTTKRPGGRGRGGGGDSLRVQHAWKRASQQATDFNAKLARDRETRRCAYYDFQTNLIHYW